MVRLQKGKGGEVPFFGEFELSAQTEAGTQQPRLPVEHAGAGSRNGIPTGGRLNHLATPEKVVIEGDETVADLAQLTGEERRYCPRVQVSHYHGDVDAVGCRRGRQHAHAHVPEE